MPRLVYRYSAESFDASPKPLAPIVVMNLRTSQAIPMMALVDTGADITTLSYAKMAMLGIDRDSLHKEDFISTGGTVKDGLLLCDFLSIALVEPVTLTPHFPAATDPIPAAFAPLSRDCILGRDMFLNLMEALFDGPGQQVILKF